MAALAVVSAIPATAQTSGLPGGASSLKETYKDWIVGCSQNGTTKRCVLSQVQTQQNGQRVFAIELTAPAGNTVSGTLVLPTRRLRSSPRRAEKAHHPSDRRRACGSPFSVRGRRAPVE